MLPQSQYYVFILVDLPALYAYSAILQRLAPQGPSCHKLHATASSLTMYTIFRPHGHFIFISPFGKPKPSLAVNSIIASHSSGSQTNVYLNQLSFITFLFHI